MCIYRHLETINVGGCFAYKVRFYYYLRPRVVINLFHEKLQTWITFVKLSLMGEKTHSTSSFTMKLTTLYRDAEVKKKLNMLFRLLELYHKAQIYRFGLHKSCTTSDLFVQGLTPLSTLQSLFSAIKTKGILIVVFAALKKEINENIFFQRLFASCHAGSSRAAVKTCSREELVLCCDTLLRFFLHIQMSEAVNVTNKTPCHFHLIASQQKCQETDESNIWTEQFAWLNTIRDQWEVLLCSGGEPSLSTRPGLNDEAAVAEKRPSRGALPILHIKVLFICLGRSDCVWKNKLPGKHPAESNSVWGCGGSEVIRPRFHVQTCLVMEDCSAGPGRVKLQERLFHSLLCAHTAMPELLRLVVEVIQPCRCFGW